MESNFYFRRFDVEIFFFFQQIRGYATRRVEWKQEEIFPWTRKRKKMNISKELGIKRRRRSAAVVLRLHEKNKHNKKKKNKLRE